MSTLQIINSVRKANPDYNNMRQWDGFFFGQKFKLPFSNDISQMGERKQYFLDYKIFLDYNIDLETIGQVLETLYPSMKFDKIPQVAYAECKTNWELGPHTHDNEIALHMTVFLNEEENEGLYVHDTDENFYDKAVYVKNVYDNCCVFPFTGKEWHGIRGDKINGIRKLIYIDWCKI